jgi:putative transposase
MGYTKTNWHAVSLFEDRAEKIDVSAHFRLKKYEVTIKEVAKVRYGTHCKYNINYHFVWIPKTRMKILVEPFKSEVANLITMISERNHWHPLALEIMPDHLHYFVSAHPKWSPMKMVQLLKQETSKKLRIKYSSIREVRYADDFWATGYYCGTAGHVSAAQVARYILEQTQKLKGKWHLFDVKPFEYDIHEGIVADKYQKRLNAYGIGGFDSALHSI